ncbi:hypothetical protein EW146_g5531 [Bondarzewia mesenterica]|uniref:GST N-terminal domain-containing protein n=1 Tax=Bondarzewia mesenterica TaxID=1095465 RepID=A0A4S4LRS6_9AGAM|nr:hypothetical protein EW146_g5531 [Bondarzewia mesenterica]
MPEPIIFYDLPGNAAKDIAWSPNTWKARFALNMKGVPYRTVWVEYPEIADLAKKLGAHHTSIRDEKPHYTLPMIYDPSTGRAISDSYKIALYLDATYPSPHVLFPAGTESFQAIFTDIFEERVGIWIYRILALDSMRQLPPRSQAYFRQTREVLLGGRLEDIAPEGEGVRDLYMTGDMPLFSDAVIASYANWIKRVLGTDSKEWNDLMVAEEGWWAKLIQAFDTWEVVDKEWLEVALLSPSV